MHQSKSQIYCSHAGTLQCTPGIFRESQGDVSAVYHRAWKASSQGSFATFHCGMNLTSSRQIPSNLTFDQAATIPLTMATAALGLYKEQVEPLSGAGLSPPWDEGGRGKYAGQPIVILGGSSSVGQHGKPLRSRR